MQAIEFETVIKNKQVFIPNQYSLNNEKVRVIILTEPQYVDTTEKTNSLSAIIANAKGKGCFNSISSQISNFICKERNEWD